jgi:hypothetical protein
MGAPYCRRCGRSPGQLEGAAHHTDQVGAGEGQPERRQAPRRLTEGPGPVEHGDADGPRATAVRRVEVEPGCRPDRSGTTGRDATGRHVVAHQHQRRQSPRRRRPPPRGPGLAVRRRPRRPEVRACREATVSDPPVGRPRRPVGGARRPWSGPTKATSARPRPSSSATMATSTPEAQRPVVVAVRSSRQPDASTAASRRRFAPVVELGHGGDAEAVDHLGRGVAQGDLLGRQADVHQSAGPGAEQAGGPLVPQRPAQHLARRQSAGRRRRRRRGAAACRWPACRRRAFAAPLR